MEKKSATGKGAAILLWEALTNQAGGPGRLNERKSRARISKEFLNGMEVVLDLEFVKKSPIRALDA